MDEKKYGELVVISVLHNNLSFEMANTLQNLLRWKIEGATEIQKSLQECVDTLKNLYNNKYAEIDLDTKLTFLKAGFGLRDYK